MKFINVRTGVILEPHNEMVIEQMKKSDAYQLVEEITETKAEPKAEVIEEAKPVKKKKK